MNMGKLSGNIGPKGCLLEDTEQPPLNEYGQMVMEYRPKRENGKGIYGSLYKLSLPKTVSLQSIQPSKKSNIWKTKSSTPPPLIWANNQEISTQKGNGQGIYGSLYKLCLPKTQY